jgi:hypothetical protein
MKNAGEKAPAWMESELDYATASEPITRRYTRPAVGTARDNLASSLMPASHLQNCQQLLVLA